MMNWKKWKIGFSVAVLFGLFTAGAGLADHMSLKSFIAVLCASMLTNLGSYLMKHPVDDISFDTTTITKQQAEQPNEKTPPSV